jgi:glycosyltransferase involved in cell wall biosynthesis
MMLKLIVQIPCFNEEQTLPLVLKDIPKSIPGISVIEVQIVDDGCTDKTVEVAKSLGVHHVVHYVGNKGLGTAFKRGIEYALLLGADIVVNTDGDNQYNSADITRLVEPIVNKQADLVIGNRQTGKIHHFSLVKKFFQWLGTRTTCFLAGIKVKDAVSGFRAYSRQALLEINIVSDFSYVLDTTVQAAKKHLKIAHIDIETNAPTRKSRLFKNIWQHIKKSGADLLRIYSLYEPFKVFLSLAALFILVGTYPVARFIYFWWIGDGTGRIQSLIFGVLFYVIGFQFIGLGILGEHMRVNRKLIEEILKKQKQD